MPDDIADEKSHEAEFDALAKRAGLTIAQDRRSALLLGFKDLRRMTALMHQPRIAASEPASVYAILSVTRNA